MVDLVTLLLSQTVVLSGRMISVQIPGTTATSGLWSPSKVASMPPCFRLFSSILESLESVKYPSAQHPPIWFLVFPLVLCYGHLYHHPVKLYFVIKVYNVQSFLCVLQIICAFIYNMSLWQHEKCCFLISWLLEKNGCNKNGWHKCSSCLWRCENHLLFTSFK